MWGLKFLHLPRIYEPDPDFLFPQQVMPFIYRLMKFQDGGSQTYGFFRPRRLLLDARIYIRDTRCERLWVLDW
jgi:hypothetical protein